LSEEIRDLGKLAKVLKVDSVEFLWIRPMMMAASAAEPQTDAWANG
jgi:hypothetical protein